jgi:hypothetical protein
MIVYEVRETNMSGILISSTLCSNIDTAFDAIEKLTRDITIILYKDVEETYDILNKPTAKDVLVASSNFIDYSIEKRKVM